ncbi:transposase [Longispora fulva]|uniref:transposase n=1 Tax=Longispora fulva TaxID=619741 RepID=UPI0022799BD9|nr:transposase [Longispora fulva]
MPGTGRRVRARPVLRPDTDRTGNQNLTDWIAAASTSGLPGISGFALNLTADLDAVTAGLSLHWNSGPVEGNVNRIKMLKRQMYGRTGFALLRKCPSHLRATLTERARISHPM